MKYPDLLICSHTGEPWYKVGDVKTKTQIFIEYLDKTTLDMFGVGQGIILLKTNIIEFTEHSKINGFRIPTAAEEVLYGRK